MPRLRAILLRWHVGLLALIVPDLRRRVPLTRLLEWFTPRRPSRLYSSLTPDEIVHAVRHRLRRPWRMRGRPCLRLGLLLFYFLRLAGVPAVLNFCVFKEHRGREMAHCWVTVAGLPVADPPRDEHVVILVHGACSRDENRSAA